MDLYRKAEPDFDIGCKRIRVATGYWSVFADNPGKAHLVTDPIDSITETGVMTKSGKNHEVDLIVYATGNNFFSSFCFKKVLLTIIDILDYCTGRFCHRVTLVSKDQINLK